MCQKIKSNMSKGRRKAKLKANLDEESCEN